MKVGDFVEPKPEWRDDPNNIPTGRVQEVDRFRRDCVRVGDDHRFFADYVFAALPVTGVAAGR